MKSSTSFSARSLAMRSCVGLSFIGVPFELELRAGSPSVKPRGLILDRSLQRERVQLPTHAPRKRVVNHLMLLDAGLALEGARNHHGGVMIAIAGKIGDGDVRVRQSRADRQFDFSGRHGHCNTSI